MLTIIDGRDRLTVDAYLIKNCSFRFLGFLFLFEIESYIGLHCCCLNRPFSKLHRFFVYTCVAAFVNT